MKIFLLAVMLSCAVMTLGLYPMDMGMHMGMSTGAGTEITPSPSFTFEDTGGVAFKDTGGIAFKDY